MKPLICYEPDVCNLGHRLFCSTTTVWTSDLCSPSERPSRSFLRFVVPSSAVSQLSLSGHRSMSPTSPARDSHSPPIPSNPSSSLPYSSRPERTPNSQGTSSIDPSSATSPLPHSISPPPFASPAARQPPQQRQFEAGPSHAPSSPSVSASPLRRPSEPGQDPRMHSPSSSSQGDTADTEMECASSSQPVGQAKPQDPPPKKKRTRTLTTPHQSAVLHALLAQVCPFPSSRLFLLTPFSDRHVH